MSLKKSHISRRDILKSAAFAVAAPLLSRRSSAEEIPVKIPEKAQGAHRILDCNILLDLPEDRPKPYGWGHRRDLCIGVIKSHKPDIVCMEEVGRGQNEDFIKAFPEMEVYGYKDAYVDGNPPRFQAAKNVIMYSKARYEFVSSGAYWLSLTPEVAGTRMPGAGLPRHVTWVRLKDIPTGREFRVLATHWDLKEPLRLLGAKIIAKESEAYSLTFPQILCGDFNSPRTSPEHLVLADAGWFDTYEIVHGLGEAGRTGNGFESPAEHARELLPRIDFIFFRGNVDPIAAEIIRDSKNGLFPSDHFFVSADVRI